MTIEEALVTKLLGDVELNALVGTRIYPDVVPQGVTTWPCLTYEQSDGDESPYLSGEPNDLHRDVFTFTVVSDKRDDVGPVRDRLLAMLGGTAARGTWAGDVFVSGCLPASPTADVNNPADGSEKYDRNARLTVTIIWGRR